MTHSGNAAPVRRHRLSARQIVAVVVLALIVIFVVQNRALVQIHLFGATLTAPLWFLLACICVLGVVIGFLVSRRR